MSNQIIFKELRKKNQDLEKENSVILKKNEALRRDKYILLKIIKQCYPCAEKWYR